jgi:hypothetical protein
LIEKFYRFRSLVKENMFIETKVDLNNHVFEKNIPEQNFENLQEEKIQLNKLISSFVNQKFNDEFPLWDLVVINNFSKGILFS